MRRETLMLMALGAVAFGLPFMACARGHPAPDSGASSLLHGNLENSGRQRSYVFYAPPGNEPFPLLLALHG